jgi:hypothetical protein
LKSHSALVRNSSASSTAIFNKLSIQYYSLLFDILNNGKRECKYLFKLVGLRDIQTSFSIATFVMMLEKVLDSRANFTSSSFSTTKKSTSDVSV